MTAKKVKKELPKPPIDQIFRELESIVSKIEGDQLSLEDSLTAFEEGVKLTRLAQNTLLEAEQKVTKLIDEKGAPTELDFPTESEDP